jgi:nitrogen fixation protein FixH
LDETLTRGKTSVISDSPGHTAPMAEADYTITLVPEPGTWAAAVLAMAGLILTQRHRIARSVRNRAARELT